MADEGISKIKQELQRKRMPPMGRVVERPAKQIKSNFNLSFNNSFNTNIANGKPMIALKAEINGQQHQIVADLE